MCPMTNHKDNEINDIEIEFIYNELFTYNVVVFDSSIYMYGHKIWKTNKKNFKDFSNL